MLGLLPNWPELSLFLYQYCL